MRRKLERAEIIARLKRAYFLYSHRHAHFHRHPSYLSARSRSNQTAKIFEKLAEKLQDFPDLEGYVRASFELYQTPYPNMLLSPQVEAQYHKSLSIWQSELDNALRIEMRTLQQQRFNLRDARDRAILRWTIGNYHPIFRLFILTEVLKSQPDTDWKETAQYEYYLWPVGYHQHPIWNGIVHKLYEMKALDIEENIACPELNLLPSISTMSSSSPAKTYNSSNSSTIASPLNASQPTQFSPKDS